MEEIIKLEAIQQRLDQFKQDQFEYWEEIKHISDECDDELLPTILENEEECNSSELLMCYNQIIGTITQLREGEIKIIEQYKYELKQLALEIKEMTKPNQNNFTQTDQDIYEELYKQEKSKVNQLEKKLLGVRKLEENSFKQEIAIELTTLRNKIQILTETSSQAEALLLKKDTLYKESHKQIQKLQKELTNKRGELSSMHDQLRSKDANLQLAQSLNKNYESELSKAPIKRQASALPKKPPPSTSYQNFALEIQELTHQNQALKNQIQQLNKRISQILQESDLKDQQLLLKEDEIRNVIKHSEKNDELSEAMEYLEMKDLEIERLHRELEYSKRNNRDNPQIKDLQNLLLMMSRNLQEKEQIIIQLQR